MPWETGGKTISVNIAGSSTLDQIEELHENKSTKLARLCERSYANTNLRLVAGEGAYGSEGFVAAAEITSAQLLWLAYFDCSNPFEEVSLINDVVVAISSLGHTWRLPLLHPETLNAEASTTERTGLSLHISS